LIDMQSMAQSTCKWIMVYQDHLTKGSRSTRTSHQILRTSSIYSQICCCSCHPVGRHLPPPRCSGCPPKWQWVWVHIPCDSSVRVCGQTWRWFITSLVTHKARDQRKVAMI